MFEDDAVWNTADALAMESPVISTGPIVYATNPLPSVAGLLRYTTCWLARSASVQPALAVSCGGHWVIFGLLHCGTSFTTSGEHPVSLVFFGSNAADERTSRSSR